MSLFVFIISLFNLTVFFQCSWEISFLWCMGMVSLKLSLDSQECLFCHPSCQSMVFIMHLSQDDMNNTFFQIFTLSWT